MAEKEQERFPIPFEKREDEPPSAWAACLAYCSLPQCMRSLPNAQALYEGGDPPTHGRAGKGVKAATRFENWSKTFGWVERAARIDELRLKNFLEEERAVWMKAREDFNKIGEAFQNLQRRLLKGYAEKLAEDPPQTWQQWAQVTKIFESLAKGDAALWKRYLESVGINTLLDNNPLD